MLIVDWREFDAWVDRELARAFRPKLTPEEEAQQKKLLETLKEVFAKFPPIVIVPHTRK